MYKPVISILLCICSLVSSAQLVYPYEDIKLEKPSDYAETEPMALSAAKYLLNSPFAESDKSRSGALKFLSEWMVGNKDFSFHKKGLIEDITYDKNVLSIYLAAVARYSLENKKEAQNPITVEKNAAAITLAYCDNPVNNFKLRKKFRKLLEQ